MIFYDTSVLVTPLVDIEPFLNLGHFRAFHRPGDPEVRLP